MLSQREVVARSAVHLVANSEFLVFQHIEDIVGKQGCKRLGRIGRLGRGVSEQSEAAPRRMCQRRGSHLNVHVNDGREQYDFLSEDLPKYSTQLILMSSWEPSVESGTSSNNVRRT